MGNVKSIQKEIMQLEGGAFQSLFDEYLYKRYGFTNLQTLGVQTGTNKPTKGTPDSYVLTDDGKYILINYGSVNSQPADKIKADILSCFNTAKLSLPHKKIKKIICGHCSTNIHIEQFKDVLETVKGIEIELIGIDTLSHDLALVYPHIAKDKLGIAIDTNQIFDIDDFIKAYDAPGINAPIGCKFYHREIEIEDICKSIRDNPVTILTGPSGIGKTRLALEACRKQCAKIKNVYCIKSNGNLLYEDIKYYIDNPGEYLLYIDDANMVTSLDNVLQTLLTFPESYEIRILITVRDYAKERVVNSACKYSKPNVIEIGRFKDSEIEDILKSELGILNSDYLTRITEIANGNIRLAYLAGIRSVDYGYKSIRNAEDIFKNYYGQIIEDAKLTKDDIMLLFFIAVAGPVKGTENKLYIDLKEQYGKEIAADRIIENLYSLELIDWFKNEITKVSDQSLGNYILYYVLFEKKWVGIDKLIEIAFPLYKNKAVYALRTLKELFYSDELSKYVADSIVAAWNNAPVCQEMEYLESFYQIDSDKALSIIKKHIEQENTIDFDLHTFDINSKKNHHSISTKEIEILGGYKYTENFDDALELLLHYYSKRPDLIMDFYFVISERLLYDKYSFNTKYNKESRLLDKLWDVTGEGENYNNSFLYLHVIEYALKTEVSYIEGIRNSKSVSFIRMPIGFSEEMAALRGKIWKNISILRTNDAYRETVNEILSEVHFNGLSKEDSIKYLMSDFDSIFENVISKDNPDFLDARTIDRYKKVAEQIGLNIDERFLVALKNPEYRVYKMLAREHSIGRTIEEDDKLRKKRLSKEIRSYRIDEYRDLFKSCSLIENKAKANERWTISTGLACIFEILEHNEKLYADVLGEYFNNNTPLWLNGNRQIEYLIVHFGYEVTFALVNKWSFDKKDKWLTLIWECMPEKSITDKVVSDYKAFILDSFNKEKPIVPSVQMLKRYGNRDQDLKTKAVQFVVDNPRFSADFLGQVYHEDDIEVILSVFKEDIDSLTKIYMNALDNCSPIDYEGMLFFKILEKNPLIWKAYVNWVKENIHRDSYEQKIFELIWSTEEWREYIGYAFKVLIEDDWSFLIEVPAQLLFAMTDERNVTKKQQWLLDKLHAEIADIEKCRKIINVVVTVMPDWKTDFILEFLKENKEIKDFKKIYLFPLSCSWSGSEVPLILDKINFLRSLKDSLKGIDYIDHRKYLEEQYRNLEKYQKEVELREYLENADYA